MLQVFRRNLWYNGMDEKHTGGENHGSSNDSLVGNHPI